MGDSECKRKSAEALEGIANATGLVGLVLPSVYIKASGSSLGCISPGASRFGGVPDVPPGFRWPTREGRPLTFLAQIALDGLPPSELPEEGWLLFFYDAEEAPGGFSPQHVGSAAVYHLTSEGGGLQRIEHPALDDDTAGPFRPSVLSFSEACDLVDPSDSLFRTTGIELDGDDGQAYAAAADELAGRSCEGGPRHHLLGHPQLIQGDMRTECELVGEGIDCGRVPDLTDSRVQELRARAPKGWRLLLQLDTDEEAPGWMWADGGTLYFWVRTKDLQQRRFDRVWAILQC